MQKTVFAAIALSSLTLTACGGAAPDNQAAALNEGSFDDLNTTETPGDDAFANGAALNTGDLNTLAPIDDPALSNDAAPLDNGVANAL